MKKAVAFLSMIVIYSSGTALADDANSTTVSQPQKTIVILVGTIHKAHYTKPDYSPTILKGIVLALKPDAILNELPLSQVDSNGRPLNRDPNKNPEGWVADTVAEKLGIRQIPFDRPDRQENYKKTGYFEREKQACELLSKWRDELISKDPDSSDLKAVVMGDLATEAQTKFSSPQSINSDAFDLVIKIKHTVFYEIAPQILAKYKGYETAARDFNFLGEQWRQRN
jgi:hypothetical protein